MKIREELTRIQTILFVGSVVTVNHTVANQSLVLRPQKVDARAIRLVRTVLTIHITVAAPASRYHLQNPEDKNYV